MVERTEAGPLKGGVYHHPMFSHYPESRIVVNKDGEEKRLRPTENRLLSELEKTPNRLRIRDELAEKVFGGYSNTSLRWYIRAVRKKVEPDPKQPKVIVSAGYQGYVFKNSVVKEVTYSHHGFTYYPERSTVVVEGVETYLTAMENKLLDLLTQNVNTTVPHEMLEQLWKDKEDVYTRQEIKTYMGYLRRKIEPGKGKIDYQYLSSVYGVGYRLCDPSKTGIPKPVILLFEASSK